MNSDIFIELKSRALNFSQRRNWLQFHNPKNLSMAITIEAAELIEIFQWWTNEESVIRSLDSSIKTDIEGEIADIIIYILHLANTLDINLEKTVKSKMHFNEVRFTDEYVADLEKNNFKK